MIKFIPSSILPGPANQIARLLAMSILLALLAGGCCLSARPAVYVSLAETWPTPESNRGTPTPSPFPRTTFTPPVTMEEKQIITTVTPTIRADSQETNSSLPDDNDREKPAARAEVIAHGLKVRSGPGLEYPVVAFLQQGDSVPVLETDQNSGWLRVSVATETGSGWISGQPAYVSLQQVLTPAPAQAGPETSIASEQPQLRSATPVIIPERNDTAVPNTMGRLVIQSPGRGEIYLVNADGSGVRRLAQGIDPALSPDGSMLAFTRWGAGEDGSLWVLDMASGAERHVLGATKQAKHPAWSPDGRRIVVNFQHGGRLEPKQVCKDLEKLGNKEPDIPWNVDPDSVKVKLREGKYCVCWVLPPDPHWGLRLVDLDDGSYQDVPSDRYAFGPVWDPANAWRIISSGLDGLVQLDVNRMLQWPLTDRREDHSPVFSPDGRYIAVAFKSGGHWQIHRLNADGSGRVVLTHVPLSEVAGGKEPWNDTAPAWSPDGSQIAFLTDRNGDWEVWVMNADGGDQRPLFGEDVQAQLNLAYHSVDERMISWTW